MRIHFTESPGIGTTFLVMSSLRVHCFGIGLTQESAMGQTIRTRNAESVSQRLRKLDLTERMALLSRLGGNVVFTSSLGIEDQVLTATIARSALPIRIVTLQTGRLFDETLDLIGQTEARLGVAIEQFYPDPVAVADYADQHGRDGFYNSVEARHACCAIRKLEPLARAITDADVWITGLRRGQSGSRSDVPFAAWDSEHRLIKANPLADWSDDEIKSNVAEHDVPLNPLHARGYPSIGCAPCTRAVKPGEPERAGRWWWEQDDRRECGLHLNSPEESVRG